MPGGRPPKRPGDGLNSPLDTSTGQSKTKLPRLERGPEDFSSVVKSKLQSYSRTGQACDRCKVWIRSLLLLVLFFLVTCSPMPTNTYAGLARVVSFVRYGPSRKSETLRL